MTCPDCGGLGEWTVYAHQDSVVNWYASCPTCDGTGQIEDEVVIEFPDET